VGEGDGRDGQPETPQTAEGGGDGEGPAEASAPRLENAPHRAPSESGRLVPARLEPGRLRRRVGEAEGDSLAALEAVNDDDRDEGPEVLPEVGRRKGVADELEPPDPEGEELPVVGPKREAPNVGRRRGIDGDDDPASRLGSGFAATDGDEEAEDDRDGNEAEAARPRRAALTPSRLIHHVA